MTKKPKHRTRQPTAPAVGMPVSPSPPFGVPPVMGQLEQRRITNVKEGITEYTLDDGSILKVKPVVVDVRRAIDQYGVDGKPLYILTLTNITETTSPTRLLRPGTVTTRRKARK